MPRTSFGGAFLALSPSQLILATMSRAADLANRKGGQKAALAEKSASHAADLAMGLTSTMQKAIKADTLLCTVCGATALGPMTACQCSGGRSKPDGGYCCKRQLLDAAQARSKESQKAKMNAGAANQGAVAAAKAKAKLEKGNDAADLDLSTQDLCEITFAPGKLGMSIEKNCACAVAEGGNAAQLKVQAGWVIRKVRSHARVGPGSDPGSGLRPCPVAVPTTGSGPRPEPVGPRLVKRTPSGLRSWTVTRGEPGHRR